MHKHARQVFCAPSPHLVQCNFLVEIPVLLPLRNRVEAALEHIFGIFKCDSLLKLS